MAESNAAGTATDSELRAPQNEYSIEDGRTPLGRASVLYSVSGAVGKVGALLTVPIVTRALGPADYGLLDLAVTLIGLATMVGGFSAELPTARLVVQQPGQRRPLISTYIATVTLLTGAIAVVLAAFRVPIASDIWLRDDAASIVAVAAAAIVLTGIQLATWHIHRISNRPRAYAALSVVDMVLKVTLILAATLTGQGASGIVGVYFVVAALGAIVGLISTRTDLSPAFVPSDAVVMLRGGALFTIMAVAFVASMYGARVLVSEAGGGAAVGAMSLAVKVASILALPIRGFQLAWGPPSMGAPRSLNSRRQFVRSIVAVMVFGGLAAIALGAFAPEVVRIAAGAQFSAAAGAVPGLAMATALAGAFFMVGVACSVAGTPAWIAGVAAVTGAGGQIVLTWLALGSIGEQAAVGMGAVGGQAIAIATLTVLAGRKSLSEPWKILALTVLALLEAVGVQLVIASSSTEARWALGATASLLILAAGVLRYSRRNLTEA